MSVRMQDVMLFAGGRCLELFGVPVWRMSRDHDNVATFTRSGAVGTLVASDGLIRSASANRVRVTWSDSDADGVWDTPALLLEASSANEALRSEEFDNATWLTTGSMSVTPNSTSAPDGSTTADTVSDTDATLASYKRQTITITADTTDWTLSCYVAKSSVGGSGDVGRLAVYLDASVAGTLDFDYSDGSVSAAGTDLARSGVEEYPSYYRFWVTVTNGNNTSAEIRLYPSYTDAVGNPIDITLQGNVIAWGAQFENHGFPTSYIATTTAAVTRNADTLYADLLAPPQALTVYAKFAEIGTLQTTNARLFEIGSAAAGDPRFYVSNVGGNYSASYDAGASVNTATLAAAPSVADVTEVRAALDSSGAVTIGQSIAGASETTATDATALALPTAWADRRIYLNSAGTVVRGHTALMSLIVARGVWSMADMRAVFS